MNGLLLFFAVLLATGLIGLMWVMATYNALLASNESRRNRYQQCLSALKEHVETLAPVLDAAQAVVKQDRAKVEILSSARVQALGAITSLESFPDDAGALQQVLAAEQTLKTVWPRLASEIDKLPGWTGNARVLPLVEALEQSENRFNAARDAYTEAAASYNALRRDFPALLMTSLLGLREAPRLELIPTVEATPASAPPTRFSASA